MYKIKRFLCMFLRGVLSPKQSYNFHSLDCRVVLKTGLLAKTNFLNPSTVQPLKKKSFSPFTFSPVQAFTLAEVLITLGIIGVVAAMTIPNLVLNYQKTQYVTALKKAYAQGNQVLQRMAVDNGTVGNISTIFSGDHTAAGEKIASYYKVAKTCGTTEGDECFAVHDDYYDGSAHSTLSWDNVNNSYKFVTADGMSFAISSYGNSCTENRGFADAPDAPTTNHSCGALYIDVNGTKKPNYLGRDVFVFHITSNKAPLLYPGGGFYVSNDDSATMATGGNNYWNYGGAGRCGGSGSKNGYYCTGRIMENSWLMDY